jgi:hypothetical protein
MYSVADTRAVFVVEVFVRQAQPKVCFEPGQAVTSSSPVLKCVAMDVCLVLSSHIHGTRRVSPHHHYLLTHAAASGL